MIIPEERHHVEFHGFPYINLGDVKNIYEFLNGNRKGVNGFIKEAKEVAYKDETPLRTLFYFKDEDALFLVFQERFASLFEKKKISSWGELMQYIS